jgi:TonB family protein
MRETWKVWEGRTVAGRYLLQSYLGSSNHSVVFLTATENSQNAAIKLIPADSIDKEEQLRRWESARGLSHPNLLRILEAGRCEIDGTELLYVVEEYAEENLSQILPERSLTAEEVREILPPVLQTLQFLHEKGLVHGHLQPSNILASGNQLKLSSDNLGRLGEMRLGANAPGMYGPPEAGRAELAAVDTWQLGTMLVEVLTQQLPAGGSPPMAVPQPFRTIAQQCLQVDPGKRLTVAQITSAMAGTVAAESPSPVDETGPESAEAAYGTVERFRHATSGPATAISNSPKKSAAWALALGGAIVLLSAAYLLIAHSRSGSASPSAVSQVGDMAHNEPASNVNPKPTPQPSADNATTNSSHVAGTSVAKNARASAPTSVPNNDRQDGVVQRVMPEVSPSARRTIHGKIKVRVRVKVDAAGNVTATKVESGGSSRYFRRIATEAAREWKFSPAQGSDAGAREYKLQFGFSRGPTEVSTVAAGDSNSKD